MSRNVSPDRTRRTWRAGVIGLRRGMSHVRVLQAMDDVDVVAVADIDPAPVAAAQRQHGVPWGGGTLEDLLGQDLDFVVVATPAPLHAAQSIQALDAGVHVLCEVQGMTSLQECEALAAAVERSGRQYMLAENCCYWAVVDTARQLHTRGQLGTVLYAEAEYIHNVPELRRDADGRPTWRVDRLPITYLTHSLGPLLWITGTYPQEVSCYGTAGNMEPGVTDLQVAIFKLANGGVARITCSFANAHWTGHRYA
ncbi:MAG: Gfo/Idh/MocA family protein, partial [Chloroflexota bacterium]